MKISNILILIGAALLVLPSLLIRTILSNKINHESFTLYSKKSTIDASEIIEIQLNSIENFRYEYSNKKPILEMVLKSRSDTLNYTIDNSKIIFTSSQIKDSNMLSNEFELNRSRGFLSLPTNEYQPIWYNSYDPNVINTSIIKYKGPQLPKITSLNSLIYVDSITSENNFDFDLDFSVVYWHNFKSNSRYADKTKTFPWKMNKLKMNVKSGSYYFNKNLIFNSIDLTATNKTDLHLEAYNYSNVKLQVDSTVAIDAPYSVWKNLKLIEKK